MKPITVQAVRRNCSTGEETSTEVTLGLYANVLRIIDGGITGYESFYIDDTSEKVLKKLGLGDLSIVQGKPSGTLRHGWVACAGSKDHWDSLFVSSSSMEKVAKHFQIWEGSDASVKP